MWHAWTSLLSMCTLADVMFLSIYIQRIIEGRSIYYALFPLHFILLVKLTEALIILWSYYNYFKCHNYIEQTFDVGQEKIRTLSGPTSTLSFRNRLLSYFCKHMIRHTHIDNTYICAMPSKALHHVLAAASKLTCVCSCLIIIIIDAYCQYIPL